MYVKEIQECTLSVKDEWSLIKEFMADKEWTKIGESSCTFTFRKVLRDCVIKEQQGENT